MTLEELAAVEEVNSTLEGYLAGCVRNHSRVSRSPSSNVKRGEYPRAARTAAVSAWE